MKPKADSKNQDLIQRLARLVSPKIVRNLGKDAGFAIFIWDASKLNHVTTSRAQLADIMGTQLATWARETIAAEDAEVAAAQGKLQ